MYAYIYIYIMVGRVSFLAESKDNQSVYFEPKWLPGNAEQTYVFTWFRVS